MNLQPNEFLCIRFEPESNLVTYEVRGYRPMFPGSEKYQVRYSQHATALQNSADKKCNMAALLMFDLDHVAKQLAKLKRENFGVV